MGAEKVQQQKKKGRPSQAITDSRVEEVYQLMIDGLDTSRIVRFGSEEWGVSRRSIEKYIAKAREKFLEAMEEHRNKDVMKMYIFKRLENLYSLNMENFDLKEARAVLADASKIFGVNAPEEIKQEITQNEVKPIEIKIIPAKYTKDDEIPD
jgi:hypothetical protein